MRERMQQKNSSDKVLFIGSDLSEIGVMNENLYLKLLQSYSKSYGSENLIYVRKYSESNLKLEKIRSICKVDEPEVPFELYLINGDDLPKSIASIYSSALYNSFLLCPKSIKFEYTKLPYTTLSKQHKEMIISTYELFEKNNKSFIHRKITGNK